MTKSAIASALMLLTLISTSPAWALDATSPGTTRKDLMQQKIDTRKQTIQNKMDELKTRMASREAALRLKLQSFRDQKKATAAARISDNLNRINEKQTIQMLKYLDKMTKILNRLEDRVNRGTPDIKDAAKARVAISDARAKIASASAVVQAQTQKDYTIQVGSEKTVKSDAQKVRDQLRTDLMTVRKMVIGAKQAVANAIRVAKSGPAPSGAESSRKEGTPSGH